MATFEIHDYVFDNGQLDLPLVTTRRQRVATNDRYFWARITIEALVMFLLGTTTTFFAISSTWMDENQTPPSREAEILLHSINLFQLMCPFISLYCGIILIRNGGSRRGEMMMIWPALIWLGLFGMIYFIASLQGIVLTKKERVETV
mmetsp:Transcript_13054/g.15668  ORF Transcript_13054/g.15668 Transcript_13054/m.15668 type:complete len:147 (-) Transcript_13054:40-480(-)